MKKRKFYIFGNNNSNNFVLTFFVKYEKWIDVGTWGMNRNINWK